jgi:enediyne biosynthesis protein E4
VKLAMHREFAPVAPATSRRFSRRRDILILGCAGAVVLVAAVVATARRAPTLGPQLACADVASSVGLQFSGDYGPVFPAMEANGAMMQQNMGNGAAVGDYNGDGYLDVVLLGQAGHYTKLFRNDPAPGGGRRFTDVTDAAGLGGVTSNARVAQFVDLSGSGRPDLVIAADYMPGGPGGPSQLFRNNGDGTFSDVTVGSGFDPTGYIVGGMTFADYDRSGRQSIWLSYWTDEAAGDPGRTVVKGAFPGHNRLYQNLGAYHFKDVTDSIGIEEYHADSFTAVFADFTGDGLPDIYQANDHRPDRFYQNIGGGQFKDSGYTDGLTRAGNSMGVATAVGPDGGLQLYVTNITDPSGLFGSNLGNTFMMNNQDSRGIHFHNAAAQYGIVDTAWGWGTSFVDMNLDGAPDLYAVQGMHAFVGNGSAHLANATSILFLNDGSGTQFSVAKDSGCDVPGDQRALVAFDYNHDGTPDLLITQVAGPTLLLQNYTGGKHWLTVAPDGPDDAGIDARVTVTAGGRTTTQILLAGGSYLAGPPREVYFGLDSAATADVVRIDWSNGTTTELHDVKADQILRVRRG